MELCSRCHKRVAVVFISRLDENNKPVNEGICLKCAKELGIAQVNDIINKMGLSEEDIDRMAEEMTDLIAFDDDGRDSDEGRAPAIDITKFLGGTKGFAGSQMPEKANESKGADKKDGSKEKADHKKKFLSQYCTNLNEKAAKGEIDNIVGRDREIDRLIHILCRRQKNNPCLIGEPGVGKTAIAEALAQRIVDGKVPYGLLNKELYLLDLTSLVAGTQFRGQFESRIKGLIEEIRVLGNVILMIDEVHNIVGAGDAEGSMSA
ncbi:MAG: ATP-dependent Clp protease ATP-binding subunit, partial [Ruminococcaceae bacterium]|nr:ATP-dependent Clp protease ATP-binding subunit [Oscillospiraceae bacterium]